MPTQDQGDLISSIEAWLKSLFTHSEAAAQFAQDPAASLAANGINANDLTPENLRQAANGVSHTPGLPADGQHVVNSFAHSPASHHATPLHEVHYLTREVHASNPTVTRIYNDYSVHVDNSQTFVNNGQIAGSVSIDDHSANAFGAGSVAGSGNANVNAATGSHSVANSGGGDVNQANGPGSQVLGHSQVGQNQQNSAGAVQQHGEGAGGPVNTGTFQGTQAGGDAHGNVTGHGNETATVGGSADGAALGFGHGHVDNASNNQVADGAVSSGGGASNASHVGADHGSGIGQFASGANAQDFSQTQEHHNDTVVNHSENVDTSQDHSQSEAEQDFSDHHGHVEHSQVHPPHGDHPGDHGGAPDVHDHAGV